MKLSTTIDAKLAQWGKEALMFCARHGQNGGKFATFTWANGEEMVEAIIGYETSGPCKGAPIYGRANQAITVADYYALKANNWTIVCS